MCSVAALEFRVRVSVTDDDEDDEDDDDGDEWEPIRQRTSDIHYIHILQNNFAADGGLARF